jgi:DNA-binding XRE family transcriptional regulator
MNETVTIPRVEYDRLCALEEDFADIKAALAVEARIASGEEELISAGMVDRLIDGEPPLRVWREFRNLTQADLARASGVNRVQIVEIEAGRSTGSVHTLRKLADALGVAVDDIIRRVDDGAR